MGATFMANIVAQVMAQDVRQIMTQIMTQIMAQVVAEAVVVAVVVVVVVAVAVTVAMVVAVAVAVVAMTETVLMPVGDVSVTKAAVAGLVGAIWRLVAVRSQRVHQNILRVQRAHLQANSVHIDFSIVVKAVVVGQGHLGVVLQGCATSLSLGLGPRADPWGKAKGGRYQGRDKSARRLINRWNTGDGGSFLYKKKHPPTKH
jgi:hypothetical protein